MRIKPLLEIFGSNFDRKRINRNNTKGSHGDISIAFHNIICNPEINNDIIDPTKLRSALISHCPTFRNFGQHDAQELLIMLLDSLHEDLNQSRRANGESVTIPSEWDSWAAYLENHKSPLVDIFFGQLFCSVLCPKCNNTSITTEPFMFLSVPLPKASEICLQNCIECYSQTNTLDEKNKWFCNSCQQKVKAMQKTGIQRLPNVLIIHLKRFFGGSLISRKNNITVKYPAKFDHTLFPNTNVMSIYSLVGVILHGGDTSGGHYTSIVKDQKLSEWYHFNDSMVNKTECPVNHPNAYILIYQKEEM